MIYLTRFRFTIGVSKEVLKTISPHSFIIIQGVTTRTYLYTYVLYKYVFVPLARCFFAYAFVITIDYIGANRALRALTTITAIQFN